MRRLYRSALTWQSEAILMWKATLAAAFSVLAAAQAAALAGENGRIAEIRERLENANRWRDHVMVVAHRGGGMEGDRTSHPENSIAAVQNSIELGVEMVELDIQKSGTATSSSSTTAGSTAPRPARASLRNARWPN